MEQFIHYYRPSILSTTNPRYAIQRRKTSKAKLLQKLLQSSFFLKQLQKAAQRSSSYAAFKSAAQRMCEHTCMQMQRSAAQRSAAHHMLSLEATCIYSAAYV